MIYIYIYITRSIRGVIVTVVRNRQGDPGSILHECASVSYSVNTIRDVMNPSILPPARSK